ARTGRLQVDGIERYLDLGDGFRVEGPLADSLDFRMMRYVRNELRLPDAETRPADENPEYGSTPSLLGDPRPEARAQLHWRLAPPLLALAFALLAVPLARSPPRQARYGRIAVGFLAYVVGVNLMSLGTKWLAEERIPVQLGLWWLLLPLLAVGAWLYFRDGH